MTALPEPAQAARPTRDDLPPSRALSIVENAPQSFAGRKLGLLVTDGVDEDLVTKVQQAFLAERAVVELIAPKVGGVLSASGTQLPAQKQLEGAPSVLFDAVALVISAQGAEELAAMPAARDFVADAYAHDKFFGYTVEAEALLEKAGLPRGLDEGVILLNLKSVSSFVERCRALRYWPRHAAEAP
jgi:catalase